MWCSVQWFWLQLNTSCKQSKCHSEFCKIVGFFIVISLFKISLHVLASRKRVLAYIPGTSLCNMPGVFSHYNYTIYILALPLDKNRTIQWFNFSCSYEVRVLSVFFQYIRIENPVVLQKMALFSVFPLQFATLIRERLRTNNPGNCLASGCNFLPHSLVAKWVHGDSHVDYFSDDVISKISSSSIQQLNINIDTKTSCFYHTAALDFLSASLVQPHFCEDLTIVRALYLLNANTEA